MDLKKYIEEQKEKIKEPIQKQYAIGKDVITQEQFDFMKGCFDAGVLPPDFTAIRKYAFNTAKLPGIPESPVHDCDMILYKGKIFAEFKGPSWQLQIPSEVRGIPPITEYDLKKIFNITVYSTEKQLNQWEIWRQPDSLEDLIRNTKSDIGDDGEKNVQDNIAKDDGIR